MALTVNNLHLKRIGLYGGSFNPIQYGHLLVARSALEELLLDRLFFIPAYQSPFKPDAELAPPEVRLRLIRLALAGETKYEVDEQEILRMGVSYTIDTVRFYRAKFPDAKIYYIIGSDHSATLPLWKDASELAKLTEFAVFVRPGEKAQTIPLPFKGVVIKGIPTAISSTLVRERVKKGLSISGLVPPAVEEAIYNLKLYK